MKLYHLGTSSDDLNGLKRHVSDSFNKWSVLSCSKSAKHLQNRHELLVRYRWTSKGLMKEQQHFNREVFCQAFLWRFWKEDDWHEVNCPGCEQGTQIRHCVNTWRNKTRPHNYMFIVEEYFFVSYYDLEINRQIKYLKTNGHRRPKVSEGSSFYLQVLQRLLKRISTERPHFGEGSWFFCNEDVSAWRIEAWCSLTYLVHVVCMQFIFFF